MFVLQSDRSHDVDVVLSSHHLRPPADLRGLLGRHCSVSFELIRYSVAHTVQVFVSVLTELMGADIWPLQECRSTKWWL